jgi:hypothetical protein
MYLHETHHKEMKRQATSWKIPIICIINTKDLFLEYAEHLQASFKNGAQGDSKMPARGRKQKACFLK